MYHKWNKFLAVIIAVLHISIILPIIRRLLVARDNCIKKIIFYKPYFQSFELRAMILVYWLYSADSITGAGLFFMIFFTFILFLGSFYKWCMNKLKISTFLDDPLFKNFDVDYIFYLTFFIFDIVIFLLKI